MSITPLSISVRLNSTSSLLLERSRIISLNIKPNPSSLSQITGNLTSIRSDLDQLELENDGLLVGQSKKGKLIDDQNDNEEIEELKRRYDQLLEILAEDEVGRGKVKDLRREEKRAPTPPLPESTPSPRPPPSPIRTPSAQEVPRLSVEPPTPGINNQDLYPFRDYPDDASDEERDTGMSPGDMLDHQQTMMNDQDERLNLLSNSIGRQNHLSVQIGSELDIHHQLLEDTDHAMDRTANSLSRARRRLDRVANDAKQHG
nr:syntaxin 8 [Kwoniella dejecticola CBS 10117]OBR83077.1 syntaxin 8 [Kwoniella dejecticola CBS 10117]